MTITAIRINEVATTNTAALLKAVKDVYLSIPKRAMVPCLSWLKIASIDGDRLEITGFDYETSITRRVHSTGTFDAPNGEVYVHAGTLKDVLAKFDQKATIHLEVEGSSLVVSQDRRRLTLKLENSDEYPKLPVAPKARVFTINSDQLRLVATMLKPFVGTDDQLPVLTGMFLEVENGVLIGQATDRFRAGLIEVPVTLKAGATHKVLLPNLTTLAPLFAADTPISVHFDGTNDAGRVRGGTVFFETHDTTISTRMLDGDFPKLRGLFPADPVGWAEVDPAVFIKAATFAATAAERNTAVEFRVGGNDITLSGGTGDTVTSDTVDAVVESGEPFTTGFNPQFLIDTVKVFGVKHPVRAAWTQSSKPVVFTSEAVPSMRGLLMPRRLLS